MAVKPAKANALKKGIHESDEALKQKMMEGESTLEEDLDTFALMKGKRRLIKPFPVGQDLVFHIANLTTDLSLLARRLSTIQTIDPNDETKTPKTTLDGYRVNSHHLALCVIDIMYKGQRDAEYPQLPDSIPSDNDEHFNKYLDAVHARRLYIEHFLPGIYDRALEALTSLAEKIEHLSKPSSLSDF